MKVILVTEERLDELVELALARIRGRQNAPADSDYSEVSIAYGTAHYHVHGLKDAIKKSAL